MKEVVPWEDLLLWVPPALVYIKMDQFCLGFSNTFQ